MPPLKHIGRYFVLHIALLAPVSGNCQDSFTFPEELLVDPNSQRLKFLNIKSIEQTRTFQRRNIEDSTKQDTITHIEYIVQYDEFSRIASFKYDFQKEYRIDSPTHQRGGVSVQFHNDTSRLEACINNGDTSYFNYVENVFEYGDFNQITNIDVIWPYRMFIDGIFIREPEAGQISTVDSLENGRLQSRKIYHDAVLQSTWEYEYVTVSQNQNIFFFVSKVARRTENNTTLYTINYKFY